MEKSIHTFTLTQHSSTLTLCLLTSKEKRKKEEENFPGKL